MSVELPPLPPAHPLDQHWHNGQWQSFGYTADQMRAYAAEALKARKPLTDEREWLSALLEEAFRDGFYAPRTYNDIVLNTADDAWEEAKTSLLRSAIERAHGIGEQA